jgi:3-oxoacyl-[acyl-carrier protein] reductase
MNNAQRNGQRKALVTGGSGDIGSAVAQLLAQQGLHVYVQAANHIERAVAVVTAIQSAGGSAEAIHFDITHASEVNAALTPMIKESAIQVIVHCAGIHSDAPMAGMSQQQWQSVIDVSLNGFFNVTQPLLLPMLRTRWGRIIALSSVAGQLGNRGQSNYAAAKAGLHGACMSLAKEVASRGVTVNVVAPGIIAGRMTADSFDAERIKALVPAARMGTAAEVASVVGFLASDAASYVSGQIIGVNGAMA